MKIRGLRIEMGEIESTLRQVDGVRAAAVLVHKDETGDSRLKVCVVQRAGYALRSGERRQSLKAMLPQYMLPAAFVFVEQLPLTLQGKVDRSPQ